MGAPPPAVDTLHHAVLSTVGDKLQKLRPPQSAEQGDPRPQQGGDDGQPQFVDQVQLQGLTHQVRPAAQPYIPAGEGPEPGCQPVQ